MTKQYFRITSLSCRLKAAERELASFRSRETCWKLRADYEAVIRTRDAEIRSLRKERYDLSVSLKKVTRQWMEAMGNLQKEHEKETKRLKKVIIELLDITESQKNQNVGLDEKRKKALHNYYETTAQLEDHLGASKNLPPR